ncbi:MAG TPA: S-adenosylmethionine:tRNA ribosyltransferase-isomerase [Cytophagaceae bacterium]|nr:S-adenosylmethionine:tRNA ribosyltransferase-isomerase [Cytophagaceae bacterium]
MNPEQISIKDFFYELPAARIAQYPLKERDQSKLLVYHEGKITESIYAQLPQHIPPASVLIFNNTKVVQARMFFKNNKEENIELFCLEPATGKDMAISMSTCGKVQWKCLVGRAYKWKEKIIHFSSPEISIQAEIVGRTSSSFIIEFRWEPLQLSFAEVLQRSGVIPIPPYLKRTTETSDLERYQTIYALHEGSVAAPTAGLHFTESLLTQLVSQNIHPLYLTLHVGAATFKPVKAETMGEHEMHSEWIDVPVSSIEKILSALNNTPLITVGTTSLRTTESLYWLGVKEILGLNEASDIPVLEQWDAYQLKSKNISPRQALEALCERIRRTKSDRLIAKTSLLIVPGYSLKLADALITNFHQPESTLMLLVASILGEDWKKVYQYALDNDFRFLSYGDGSLLWRQKKL